MVKICYAHNNKFVDKDIYEAASILFNMSRAGNSSKKVFGPTEESSTNHFTRHQRRINFIIRSPQEHVDDVVDDDEQEIPGSTSINIVNELPPPENEQVVVEEAADGGDGGAIIMPPMPAIANIIGACSPAFEKQLTKSDVTEGQGRLTLWKEFVNLHLVPMFNEDEDLVEGIDVTVFDAEGREYDMTFKLWASKLYVLMKGWKEFYKTNNLTQAGENVSLWMFRHVITEKLCFAIAHGRFE